jgi:hypothetical protein
MLVCEFSFSGRAKLYSRNLNLAVYIRIIVKSLFEFYNVYMVWQLIGLRTMRSIIYVCSVLIQRPDQWRS